MKKTFKLFAMFALIAVILVTFTACGNKDDKEDEENKENKNSVSSNKDNNDENDKLVATKTTSEDGMEMKETITVNFKNGVASELEMIYQFEDEEIAQEFYDYLIILLAEENIEIEDEKVMISFLVEEDSELGVDWEGATRKEIKEELEDEGYTVK